MPARLYSTFYGNTSHYSNLNKSKEYMADIIKPHTKKNPSIKSLSLLSAQPVNIKPIPKIPSTIVRKRFAE